MENNKSFKTKLANFFTILSIRLHLLLIWAEKNISVLLKTVLIVIGILILTNVIDSHEFLVIFGLTQAELNEVDWDNLQTVENILTGSGGLAYILFVAFKRTKKIALEDIKSRKLKIKLIKSNLYFDENNNLCKKIEKETNLDINGDNKIGDNTIISNTDDETLLSAIPRATTELFKVMTTKITIDDTVVEEEQLNQEVESSDNNIVIVNEKLYTETNGSPEVEETTETAEEETVEDEEEDNYRWIDRLRDFISSFKITFGRNDDEDDDVIEVIPDHSNTTESTEEVVENETDEEDITFTDEYLDSLIDQEEAESKEA